MKPLQSLTGVCVYCGQTTALTALDDCYTQEAADEIATARCKCPDAYRHRVLEHTEKNIEKVFGQACEGTAVEPISCSAQRLILKLAENVFDGVTEQAQLTFQGKRSLIKAKVSGSEGSSVTIQRTDAIKREETA